MASEEIPEGSSVVATVLGAGAGCWLMGYVPTAFRHRSVHGRKSSVLRVLSLQVIRQTARVNAASWFLHLISRALIDCSHNRHRLGFFPAIFVFTVVFFFVMPHRVSAQDMPLGSNRRHRAAAGQNGLCADHRTAASPMVRAVNRRIESLVFAGPVTAGWGTAFDHPHEYGTSWEGFGQRYGMRLTGVSTGNAMEASLGAIWGEDPRYFRTEGQPFKKRLMNILDLTFRAYRDDGERHFAYARIWGMSATTFSPIPGAFPVRAMPGSQHSRAGGNWRQSCRQRGV